MTDLEKPVVRRTSIVMKGKRIVVNLRPDGYIEFWLERNRESFKLSIEAAFRYAQQQSISVPIRQRS